jgi:hypothetical protein
LWAGWSIGAVNETIEVVTMEEGFHKGHAIKLLLLSLVMDWAKLERGATEMGCWV